MGRWGREIFPMAKSNIYVPFWSKHVNVLRILIGNAKTTPQSFKLSYADFHALGEREVSDYRFNMDIKKGNVSQTQIGGSAVARDLFHVLVNDPVCKARLNLGVFNFNIDKDYQLIISAK